MNKKQFIEWLLIKFMSNAEDRQADVTIKDFEMTIPADIDFDYLRVSILTHYEKRIMPDYKFMQQYFRKKTTEKSNTEWTPTTWDIYGKTKDGRIYAFANYMGVSEYQGREAFLKGYPKLEYVGNNRAEMLERINEKEGL